MIRFLRDWFERFADWLGRRSEALEEGIRTVRKDADSPLTRFLLGVAVVLGLLNVVLWLPVHLVAESALIQPETLAEIDTTRRTVIQLIGGFVVFVGLYLTYRRIRVTEDGQVTERFSRAIEQLGSEKMAVRLGGIYALERIARDSETDHWTVMETLCAFVRERRPLQAKERNDYWKTPDTRAYSMADGGQDTVPTDVQAALTVIGRRDADRDKDGERLNLARCDLRKANLGKANLSRARLWQVDLREAYLVDSDLREAYLVDSDLKKADLREADLREASLGFAKLNRANLAGANLKEIYWLTGGQLCKARSLFNHSSGEAKLEPDLRAAVKERCPHLLGPDDDALGA